MATKSYSKHKEFKEYSSSSSTIPPYTDEQFDMLKSELIPKGSKLESLGRNGVGAREYHYEYKEEKHPSGKYDRKDMRTVEEFTIPPKSVPKESSSYYYEREERELPAITTGTRTYNYETTSSTPGYSKVKSSKVTKDMSHNVEELDSLLDDLQKDQERQLYKSGYTSDTAESTSFDYRKGTPVKAPSSGYSTLKHEERVESSSWGTSPLAPPVTRQAELRQEVYREEKTESRVVPSQVSPALPQLVPAPVCANCHQPPTVGTLSRSGTPMNKVTTTVKTYTYEVPAGQDPTTVPIPVTAEHSASYTSEEHLRNTSTCVGASPGGCQHCPHCNSRLRDYRTLRTDEHTSERMVYPGPGGDTKLQPEPRSGHGPYGPTSYKYSETSYSSQNTAQRFPPRSPGSPPPPSTPSPFPRPATPSGGTQQTPKKLDDLLAEFPEARFPTQPDGLVQRKVETRQTSSSEVDSSTLAPGTTRRAVPSTTSAPGPPTYYPPGYTMLDKKTPEPAGGQSSAMMQGGGAYASGRGAYEYEAGARSREKHSEKKTAVPVCLPLCCAMPCVIM